MNIFDIVIVQPIFNLLLFVYSIIPGADFGVALIIVTIMIRFALWPLMKKQLHQTKAMRKLQPELQKIKKKTKGNKQAQSMQMMELYKQHGVSPFSQLGTLIIQLPIFIALYHVIRIFTLHRDEIEKFTYGFMQHFQVVADIIKNPDTFNEKLFGFVDLTGNAISSDGINVVIVILAIIAAFTQFWISKQTMPQTDSGKRLRDLMAEAGEGKQPDQAEMSAIMSRKMMKFLPIMMFVIMMSLPAALALYYSVSNMVAFVLNRHILKQDEEELEEIASKSTKKKSTNKPKPQKAKLVKDTTIQKNNVTTKKSEASSKPTKKANRDKMKSGTNVTRITAKDK